MANKSRYIVAESKIRTYFKEGQRKVFSRQQLVEVLEQNRNIWNLPISMYVDKFTEKLQNSGILYKEEFVLNGLKERFLTEEASVFQVAVSLVNKSYLSHYSAVYLHGLSNQIPKTIYISFEQSKKNNVARKLDQNAIDAAFMKPQRKSGTTAIYKGFTFVLHNGMYSNRSGVYLMNDIPVTNIERTLIDIAVRPAYAGGVDSVQDIYRRAIEKISINKLIAIFDKLNFIYPYHQALGYYLENAGLDRKKLDVLYSRQKQFKFYLNYEMLEKDYNDYWRIYYPKGM